jgi:hypothetical protein
MLLTFFVHAMRSRERHFAFRRLAIAQILIASCCAWIIGAYDRRILAASVLLVTGIVQGAMLVGWRLSQIPKCQGLELLLGSPVRPALTFTGEALSALGLLTLVTFAGFPSLWLLAVTGRIDSTDLVSLVMMPLTWGALTGIGLATWAYEPPTVRIWGERLILALVVFYLAVGLMAGEHIRTWLLVLPASAGQAFLNGFEGFHRYNPFAVLAWRLNESPGLPTTRIWGLELCAMAATALLSFRAAWRLKPHFDELHYQSRSEAGRLAENIGSRPLAWWAVRRVTRYSGRANLWLASVFGIVYACFLVAGNHWPPWLGRGVFVVFEEMGGYGVIATALVMLATVPAIFQYGLWSHDARDRCRWLELLMLTSLDARDYWNAAARAAWRRGRGYLAVAVLLLASACLAGQITIPQLCAALGSAAMVWALYFSLGFRAFSKGIHANALGIAATLLVPALVVVLASAGWRTAASCLPPGMFYASFQWTGQRSWLLALIATALVTFQLAHIGLRRCDVDLRAWYARYHHRLGA